MSSFAERLAPQGTQRFQCKEASWYRANLVRLDCYGGFVIWKFSVPEWGNKCVEYETPNDDPLVFVFQEQRKWKESVSCQTMIDLFNHDYRFGIKVVDGGDNLIRYQRVMTCGQLPSERVDGLPKGVRRKLTEAVKRGANDGN